MGPGELPHVLNLGVSSSYSEKVKELTLALPCVARGKKAPSTSISTFVWIDWL